MKFRATFFDTTQVGKLYEFEITGEAETASLPICTIPKPHDMTCMWHRAFYSVGTR